MQNKPRRRLPLVFVVLTVCCLLTRNAVSAGSPRKKGITIIQEHQQQHRSQAHINPSGSSGTGFLHHHQRYGGGTAGAGSSPSNGCPPGAVLRVDFTVSGDGEGKMYGNTYGTGILLAEPTDYFEYEVMWNEKQSNCGVEFEVGSTWRLRDHGARDALGYSPHSEKNANMTAVAYKQWYKRRWHVGESIDGKYIDKFVFSAFTTPGKSVTCFFKNIRVVKRVVVDDVETWETRRVVWTEGGEPPTVNSYFPGTIASKCQNENVVDSSTFTMTNNGAKSGIEAPLRFGSSLTVSGLLELKQLGQDEGSSLNTDHECPNAHPLHLFRNLAPHRILSKDKIAINHMFFNIKKDFGENDKKTSVVLMSGGETLNMNETLPLSIHKVIQMPQASPLTHLLDGATLEVVLQYALKTKRLPPAATGDGASSSGTSTKNEEQEEDVWVDQSTSIFSQQLSFAPQ